MTATPFSATPTTQAFAPAKSFADATALRYAAHAARTFHVSYAVWECTPRLRLLQTFPALSAAGPL